MPRGFDELTDAAESERRHIVVNALVLPVRNQIGFMPDPYIATAPNVSAKARPSRQMGEIGLLRIPSQSPEGFPILQKHDRPSKPQVTAHKTKFGPPAKLLQHGAWQKTQAATYEVSTGD